MSFREPTDEENKKKKDAFANFASKLDKVVEEDKEAKKEILKDGIESMEKSDKGSIMSSKALTGKLSSIRQEAGMSAFVGTSGKIKSPKFKRKEFIELLARELLLIGSEEMRDKGGIISIAKLTDHFAETRENWELRDKDIKEGVEYLKSKELIPKFNKISDDLQLIHFRPIELSQDTQEILKVAHGIEVTRDKLVDLLGWTAERVDTGISLLKTNGLAVEDDGFIYFPGLW